MTAPDLEQARESLAKAKEALNEFNDPCANTDAGTAESLSRVTYHLIDALLSLIPYEHKQ